MNLVPKHKSDIQLTGIDKFDLSTWSLPYKSSVTTEFKDRFENISKMYKELAEEVKWNDIIYGINILFQPVIGNPYYLYYDDKNDKYSLSLIAPWEWNKESLGTFKLDHNGKWNKID